MSDPIRVNLVETKTSSEDISPGSTFWKRTLLDPQLSLYLPALRKLGYEPVGAIYDVLRKPGQDPSNVPILDDDKIKIVLDSSGARVKTKDGKKWRQTGDAELGYVLKQRPETPEEYGARCAAAIAEDPNRYYQRGIVVRLEADEREAAFDLWNNAVQMREAKRLNVYPRNPDSCVQWSRECDYLSVCAGMADINDPLLFRFEEDEHPELGAIDADKTLLTQSSMRCYRSCPRKFFYRYIARMRVLAKSQALATGTSIHEAIDVWRNTRNLTLARAALVTTDAYVRAKEDAMLVGYAARWGEPKPLIAVEKLFRLPLINPSTGAMSRSYELGGKFDGIQEA